MARLNHTQAKQALTPDAFARLAHVSVAPSGLTYFSAAVDAALEAHGLQRRIAMSSPHFVLAAHLASQSELVLVLPCKAALALAKFLPLEVFELPMKLREVEISMYWHERTHRSGAYQWLRSCVREILGPPQPQAEL